ncbi:diguanylate cyclase [Novimethylophilus kurashikiensis]|uniref:Diguanylate cyclase n=1 Tax=Novimethylophilus kurashikiensis TaxID=1825523 RepID=A0A2R5F4A8_9PROT|nr:EAL domain-containing protein [Novimethylophilus kurashikiensis]GBG13252.1 diguanylate cyclase [Novimethylophilus kurashikiensis]
MSIKLKIFLYLLFPIFAADVLIQLYDFVGMRANTVQQIRHAQLENAENNANRVDALLNRVSAVASTTAQFLSVNEDLSEQSLYQVLKHVVGSNSLIYGAAIAFEPGEFEGRKLFCPYVFRSPSGVKGMDIGTQAYDYTQPQWEWYYLPRKLSKPVWTEPYFDRGAGNIKMVTFSVPFYRHWHVAGIATVDLDLGRMLDFADIKKPANGDAEFYILSKSGMLLFPQGKTAQIDSLATSVPGLKKDDAAMLQPLLNARQPRLLELSGANGTQRWAALVPIKTWDWVLLSKVEPEAALKAVNGLGWQVIGFILLSLVLGTVTAWFLIGRIVNPLGRLARAVNEIAHGNLSVRVKVESEDEVGQLAQHFSIMAQRLAEREHALVTLNSALESRVVQRTTALQERQVKLETILETALDAVVQIDVMGVITGWNGQAENIFGWSRAEAMGRLLHETVIPLRNREVYLNGLDGYRETGDWPILNSRFEMRVLHRSGHEFLVELTVTAVTTEGRREFNAFIRDITDRRQAEEHIKQLAYFDSLTQLPNRRLLMQRLQHALTGATHNEHHAALLMIDLDNFKTINDTLGHDTGDLLLQQVAQRLVECVRDVDTVARLGGDEFMVLLDRLSADAEVAGEQAQSIGEKILLALGRPYLFGEQELVSPPSIGVTVFEVSASVPEEVMKRADIAMYQSKKAGKNTLRFFNPDMQATIEARHQMERWLQQALAKNEFRILYQLQVTEERQEQFACGAELLLRWQHPVRGLVSPAEFIPLAEETGLIVPIGQWVLETACRQIKTWESDPLRQHLQLSVNVSARQFRHPEFVRHVLNALQVSGANPRNLKLELTESLVLENLAEAIAKMQAIKQVGVQFAMDDFGTGHSSLSNLKKLPLDQIKIDQSFVRDLPANHDDAVIVQTIISMARNLGMEIIAEGVETQAQCEFLAVHECRNFQGYLFSRPVDIDEFERLLLRFPVAEQAALTHLKSGV